MKVILTTILFLCFILTASGQVKIHNYFFSCGLDYRQYPIDIEDVPRGGYSSNGYFYGEKFWQTASLHSGFGIVMKKNWQLSITPYFRYNHLHWLKGKNYSIPESGKRMDKKNVKFDLFLDVEKKFQIKKDKPRFITVCAGIGYVNMNTRYNLTLRDTLPSGGLADIKHYEGTLLHFGPRLSLGYQYEKIKAFLDAYMIEGPDLTNLTSLWIGGTISYEMPLKKKKKKQ
jgi:hypothetical protein